MCAYKKDEEQERQRPFVHGGSTRCNYTSSNHIAGDGYCFGYNDYYLCNGGAGYVKQAASSDSGTLAFSLGSSNEAQTLTIAIAPR